MAGKRKTKSDRKTKLRRARTQSGKRSKLAIRRQKSRKSPVKRAKRTARRTTPSRTTPVVRSKTATSKKPPRRIRIPRAVDPRMEPAVLEMNRGRSLTAAAREAHLPREELLDYLVKRRLVKRIRGRWVIRDKRPRRVLVMTRGRSPVHIVLGYDEARLVGEHRHATGQFVATNNLELIKPFEGRSVQAVNGRRYVLETDPNALHRIAAMDTPEFHEIYQITSNS